MTTKELKEYLDKFDGDEKIGFLVVNTNKDIIYKVNGFQLMDPNELKYPVILLSSRTEESLSKYRADEDGLEVEV